MGEIVTLQDVYKYELPDVPPINEIWYSDIKDKSYQYWKTPFAKDFRWLDQKGEIRNVKQMNEKDRQEYINYWREKWLNGLWFMNNGIPTYITGAHIDHLVFNKHKAVPYMYLESQKERFYFRDLTNKEPLCDGRCWSKGRRCGITEEQVTENVRVINSDFGNHVAMQSDSEAKGKISLMQKVINVHIKRPLWMREVFYSSNGKVPRASLELIEVTVRTDENYPLGGTARGFPSTAQALDGLEFMLVTMDELSKWSGSLPMQTFEVNIKTIINPGKRGKLDALSTTGDSDLIQKAVKDWIKLIADSNPKILNENGKTNSGLWHYFVSYIHSFELMEKFTQMGRLRELLDVHGFINKEVAEEYIWNEIKKYPKDSKEYIFALYKMPMEPRHSLLTPTGQGYFSKIKITDRLNQLREMPNDKKPYVIGAFEYDALGKVYFESNAEREKRCEKEKIAYTAGRWKVALHPFFSSERKIDTRNRYRKSSQGVYFPTVNVEYGIGYDPFRYDKKDTVSPSLSDAGIIVYKKFDYFNSDECNQYCALYLHRPDTSTEANEECIKASKYYGAPVMHERVIETVQTDFEAAGMLPFLMKNQKDGKYGMWIDSQGKVVKNAIDLMVARFNSPLKTEDDIDYYETHPFEETLMDMDGFDISNTTAFDSFMAMIELEHCLKELIYTNETDKSANSMSSIIHQIIPIRN